MKKLSFIVVVALMAFAASVFAQDAAKPATQEKTKTTEVKQPEMKKEAAPKATKKVSKKAHRKAKKAPKKDAGAGEQK
jgi:Ni/Co efflux regulator RcnB